MKVKNCKQLYKLPEVVEITGSLDTGNQQASTTSSEIKGRRGG